MKPLLGAAIQVFEEKDFIIPTLQSLEDLCDGGILIGEGAWKTTAEIRGSARSKDGTIELIEDFISGKDKFKLVFVNEESQLPQRNRIWELYQENFDIPQWINFGDGDEIHHEKEMEKFRNFLLNTKYTTICPEHYRFWTDGKNNLKYWDKWVTGGSRVFKIDGDPKEYKCEGNCNWYSRDGDINYFRRKIYPLGLVFHPSYAKNTDRQKLKYDHRTIDDKHLRNKFPHPIKEGRSWLSEQHGEDWFDSLKTMPEERLPKYLRAAK